MNYDRCYAKGETEPIGNLMPSVHAINPIEGKTWCGQKPELMLPYLRRVLWGTPDGDWCGLCAVRHAQYEPTPEEESYLRSRERAAKGEL